MEVDTSIVVYLAETFYNITPVEGSIVKLCGYSARNFVLTDIHEGNRYLLKIVDEAESDEIWTGIIDEIVDCAYQYSIQDVTLDFVVPKLIKTSADRLSARADIRCKSVVGDYQIRECAIKLFEYFPGIDVRDLVENHKGSYEKEDLYPKLGRVCNQIFSILCTKRSLLNQLKAIHGDSFPWQLMTCKKSVESLADKLYPDHDITRRMLIDEVLKEFEKIEDKLAALPEYLLHGDLSTNNILIDLKNPSRLCLVDFQDLQVGPQIVDLAILMLYSIIKQSELDFSETLKLIPRLLLEGYQSSSKCQLKLEEMYHLPTLMKLRLCQSLLNGLIAYEADQSNHYVLQTNLQGWELLKLLVSDPFYSDSKKLVNSWTINLKTL